MLFNKRSKEEAAEESAANPELLSGSAAEASGRGADPSSESDLNDLDLSWDSAAPAASDDNGIPEEAPSEKATPVKKTWLLAAIAAGGVLITALIVFLVYTIFIGGGLGSGKAAAKVNNDKVTVAQLDAEIAKIKMQSPAIFETDQGGMEEGAVRKMLLDELINRVLLEQEAKKEGVEVTEEEVQAQIDAISASYPDETAFEDALKAAGYTADTLKAQRRYDLLVQGLLTKKIADNSVTDADAKAYYDQNKDNYVEQAGKRASHILFDINDKATAEEVLAELKASNNLAADFAAAAQKYSKESATAANGGDLGWPTAAYVAEFQKALDKLKVQELSNLVKTEYGYHIIFVTDERKSSTKSFEEVQAQIKDMLLNQKRNEEYQTLLEALHNNAKIVILDSAVKAYDKAQEEKASAPADTSAGQPTEGGEASTE